MTSHVTSRTYYKLSSPSPSPCTSRIHRPPLPRHLHPPLNRPALPPLLNLLPLPLAQALHALALDLLPRGAALEEVRRLLGPRAEGLALATPVRLFEGVGSGLGRGGGEVGFEGGDLAG